MLVQRPQMAPGSVLLRGHHAMMTALSRGKSGEHHDQHKCVAAAAATNGNGNGKERHFDYDLFTIGAGSGGVRASRFAAQYGARVAICELPFSFKTYDGKGGVGGTCVLRGCVPKKVMVLGAEYAVGFKDSANFGWDVREAQHNWEKLLAHKRRELMRLNDVYKKNLADAKVELVEGRGKVLDAHTVEVDGKKFSARNILISTGAAPVRPKSIKGWEHCMTSDDALELTERPNKIAIIGGGYIGVEFSGIFARFGADVHLIARQEMPLSGFDDELRKFAFEQYKAVGINMHMGTQPNEVHKEEDGTLTLIGETTDGKPWELRGNTHVLLATGRAPNTKGLGLEEAGVQLGKKGEVVVDECSRTNVPSIWAVGDVTNRVNLTPAAVMQGMAVARCIALGEQVPADNETVPSAVFSHPELATVGLTEEKALASGHKDLDIYTTSFKPLRHTISGSPLRAFIKLVVDAHSRKLLGVHMCGNDAPEIMQGMAVAVKIGATKEQLDSVVGIHPTAAEELVMMRSVSRKVRQGEPVPVGAKAERSG